MAVACVLSSVASSAAVRTSASDIVGSVLWCGGVCGAFVLVGFVSGPVSFRDVKELKINQSAWFYYNTPPFSSHFVPFVKPVVLSNQEVKLGQTNKLSCKTISNCPSCHQHKHMLSRSLDLNAMGDAEGGAEGFATSMEQEDVRDGAVAFVQAFNTFHAVCSG